MTLVNRVLTVLADLIRRRRRSCRPLALANGGISLALASPEAPVVDQQARTISGLAVPFGPAGQTSQGRLQFSAGALTWTDARRVKLLREHNQNDVVGYATELVEQPDGLHATFHVPPGENGDRALAEAAAGLRDAFSVGVQLDDRTRERMRRAQGAAVQGTGALRETSLVSVPAFDDARVGSVAAHAELVVASWSDPTTGEPVRCTTCHHIHAAGVTACSPEHLQAAQAALAAASQPAPQPPPHPTPTPAPTDPVQPTQPAQPTPAANPDPAPLAVAGAALTAGEPSTYTFSGDGPGLIADAWAARMLGDSEAATRLQRFNAELVGGNPASTLALAAVLVSDDVNDGAGGGLAPNGTFTPSRTLPMREVVDRGRPMLSRVNIVPIRNAQPFLLPIEGEFDGVDDHVEGTAHVVEGTLDLSDDTMKPKAISGAFRLSREIADSTNPAIDRIALRAMLRDYRRKTEAKFLTALTTATGAATAVAGPIGLDLALIAFGDDDSDEPTFVAAAKTAVVNLAGYLDGDGRQLLPAVGPANAVGTRRAGATGYQIGGAELVKSASITGTDVLAVDEQGVLVVESPVQTFRFDEVEGPGIIKLALFAYFGAKVLDADAVERYSVAAYVAP